MSKKLKIIIISLAAAVLIAGAVFGAVKFKKPVYPVRNAVSNGAGNAVSDWVGPEATGVSPADNAGISAPFKTYVHPVHGFSFDYPADWSVDAFAEEGEEAVVVQNEETGIAIFIYPFDEPGSLTKERVLKDVPDIKIENEIALKIAGPPRLGEASTIDALGFDSNEREFGPTKEVWFAHNGFLYQISAALESGEVLYKMTETWKFN